MSASPALSTAHDPPPATEVTRWGVLARAVAAWLAMGVGLGAAGALGEASGLTGWARQGLTAAICGGFAVTAILVLRRGVDRKSLTGMGLKPPPRGLTGFVLGLVVTGGCAVAVFGLGAQAGMLDFGAVDGPRLAGFLAMNTVIALALEAVPEELVFRGYVLTTLNRRLRRWTASILQIGLFSSIMVVVSTTQSTVSMALSDGKFDIAFAPTGMNPVDYLILMAVFGFALTCARWATGSILVTMGVHLAFLTANRLALESHGRGTGWNVAPTPDAALLVPAYLLGVAVVFLVIARVRGGSMGWRGVNPEL
ncbi:MAG: lysostaphin resistance A-like protein [Stackebrandtia sp.]